MSAIQSIGVIQPGGGIPQVIVSGAAGPQVVAVTLLMPTVAGVVAVLDDGPALHLALTAEFPAAQVAAVVVDLSKPGGDGADGLSAYQVAVAGGYAGTEAQWLASLQGDAGVNAQITVLTLAAYLALDAPTQMNGTWYVIPK